MRYYFCRKLYHKKNTKDNVKGYYIILNVQVVLNSQNV